MILHLSILPIRCSEIKRYQKTFKIIKEYVILEKLGFDKPNFFYEKLRRPTMKIIKSKSIIFLLVFLFIFTAVFPIFKKTRLYTFTDKNKNNEYKLIHNIEGKFLLSSNDSFERIDKVGENDNYFAIFFLSRRNEKVETPSIKNYFIIDKNTNEIYKTSEKDITEKGIILNDVDTFLKKKGVLVYDKKILQSLQ